MGRAAVLWPGTGRRGATAYSPGSPIIVTVLKLTFVYHARPIANGGLMPQVKPVPEGYTRITPYLVIKGAEKAIDFYREVFGAVEEFRMPGPDNTIGHAELLVGDSHIMLADENPQMGYSAPEPGTKLPLGLMVYVDNVDEAFKKAVDLGATVERPVADQFYGDRTGGIVDPFGYRWYIATHIEDVSPEEMQRRAEKAHAA